MKNVDFTGVTLQQMEGKRRMEIEEEARKKDIKKQKTQRDEGVAPVVQMNK